jgi:uncharacterized caspase-like protein
MQIDVIHSALILIRSASDGEAAQESKELGGGSFTHYLLTGLRGAADFDHRISLDEAYIQ